MKREPRLLYRQFFLAVFSFFLVSALGCARLAEFNVGDKRVNEAAASQLFPNEDFEKLDLPILLDPKNRRNQTNCVDLVNESLGSTEDPGARETFPPTNDVDAALVAFNQCYDEYDDKTRKRRRNAIQERVLQVSDQYCNVFETYLQRLRSKINFSLGSLATITGVAGGIVTGIDGSRLLSGLSGISSGIRAEFNQQYFLNLAMPVITKGIESRRTEIYRDIILHGQSLSYEKYEIEAAIKDAIKYHGACSITTAFETAENAIETVEDPGLDQAHRTIMRVNQIRQAMNQGAADTKAFRKIRGTAGVLKAGKPFAVDEEPEMLNPSATLSQEMEKVVAVSAAADIRIDGLFPDDEEKAKALKTTPLGESRDALISELKICRDPSFEASRRVDDADQEYILAVSDADKNVKNALKENAEIHAKSVNIAISTLRSEYATLVEAWLAKLSIDNVPDGDIQKVSEEFLDSTKKLQTCTKLIGKAADNTELNEQSKKTADQTCKENTDFCDVQKKLKAVGFDPVALDGLPGPNTFSALDDYLAEIGISTNTNKGNLKKVSTDFSDRFDALASGERTAVGFKKLILEQFVRLLGEDPGSADGVIENEKLNPAVSKLTNNRQDGSDISASLKELRSLAKQQGLKVTDI